MNTNTSLYYIIVLLNGGIIKNLFANQVHKEIFYPTRLINTTNGFINAVSNQFSTTTIYSLLTKPITTCCTTIATSTCNTTIATSTCGTTNASAICCPTITASYTIGFTTIILSTCSSSTS